MPHATLSRTRLVWYWIATSLIALEMVTGGIWDLLRTAYVRGLMDHLGYPEYMLTILGIWKLLGAIAIVVPRFPRLKEWAYAGMIFDLTGAAASHAICREGVSQFVVTMVLALIVLASWSLRPDSRRLAAEAGASVVPLLHPQTSRS
ncbi:MAG TPA: DoxX family protein [Acidobacteriaceae bacterium]